MSVEETLKKIVTRVTRKPDAAFSPEATFEELDADSLDIVQILVALEDTYDIEIQDEELQEIKNMGDFIAYVERKVGEKGK
ncbi:MAG: acyl carrier protein [Chloroflexota bacterium]|nr:acyl carrier protein [Chloroflexota bacterium]